MPKKKLPTGPIRIDLPTVTREKKTESSKQDSENTENSFIENEKLVNNSKESTKQDSSKVDNSIIESSNKDFDRIENTIPESTKQEANQVESNSAESNKTDSIKEESSKPASTKKERIIQPSIRTGFQIKDSNKNSSQKSSLPEARITESTIVEGGQVESIEAEQQNQENTVVLSELKPESSLLESKKVAMRLSSEAASTLRQFRAETGIPYEILVDVMIRNWSGLPNRTKTGYLKQAKQIRQMRLMAGQEKTLQTMRQKYSEQS